MRSIFFASLFLGVLSSYAIAGDIHVLAPPVVDNAGLGELAAAFTRQTGTKVSVDVTEMLKIPDAIRKSPIDVFFLEPALLQSLARDGETVLGDPTFLGRVNIGLAVIAGAPHPDISTVPKLVAALRSAKIGVVYSDPDPVRGSMVAKMVDAMLKRKEFDGVHGVISSKGNGVSGLMRGEGDMAFQLETEILPHKEVELVDALPEELREYIDISFAVSAKTRNRTAADAFVTFLKSPDARAVWKAHGLIPK